MGSANVPRRSIALSETSMNTARARRACARCMDKQPAAEGDVFNTSQLVRCKDSVGRAPRDVGESPQQHSAHRVRRVRMNQRRRMMVWAVNTPSTSTNSAAQQSKGAAQRRASGSPEREVATGRKDECQSSDASIATKRETLRGRGWRQAWRSCAACPGFAAIAPLLPDIRRVPRADAPFLLVCPTRLFRRTARRLLRVSNVTPDTHRS